MNNFVAQVLQRMDGDPSQLGQAFETPLSLHEELLLCKLDEEMGMRVERILDHALASTSRNGEIMMSQHSKNQVMFFSETRKAIRQLIAERGHLGHWWGGLN